MRRFFPTRRASFAPWRCIGYRLEEALADIIDNSIDAGAKTILVRFVHVGAAVKRVVIADDGAGMNESKLRNAMQVGADSSHATTHLGKYGTGMKTASFSQCDLMTVISRAKGKPNGRCWERRAAESGWRCGIIDTRAAERLLGPRPDITKECHQGPLAACCRYLVVITVMAFAQNPIISSRSRSACARPRRGSLRRSTNSRNGSAVQTSSTLRRKASGASPTACRSTMLWPS